MVAMVGTVTTARTLASPGALATTMAVAVPLKREGKRAEDSEILSILETPVVLHVLKGHYI